jgi:hypothetical protein
MRRHVTPSAQRRLLANMGRNVSSLVDCFLEAQNNLERNEVAFLQKNLRGCFSLANRLGRRRKSAARLLGKVTR